MRPGTQQWEVKAWAKRKRGGEELFTIATVQAFSAKQAKQFVRAQWKSDRPDLRADRHDLWRSCPSSEDLFTEIYAPGQGRLHLTEALTV